MQSLVTLSALLEIQRGERDQALLGTREVESLALQASMQVEQLDNYRAEYVQRWSGRFRVQGNIELVRCYQGFMQRLEQAITQQRLAAEHAQQRLRVARDLLRQAELRVGSVEKLIERRQSDHKRRAARHEQSQSDEAAQRSHAQRRKTHQDAPGGDPTR